VSSVVTYPSYLTFFNEIAGGARNGHKILLDSNLDWGQDLKGLKAWMVRHDVQNIQFLYFGFYDIAAPGYYGINAFYLPGSWVGSEAISPESPQRPDYLAISANHLYGYFHGGRDEGFVKPFQSVDPSAIIGNSILVYSLDRAISQYRNIVQANSGSADSHYKLANLLNHRGDSEEAIQEYRRAIQIDPEFAEAHDKLSIALLKTEALEEAIRHLRRVLALTPLKNRHETQFWLGAALVKQGHVREAENYFKEAIKTQPGFAPAYYNLGILSAAQGEVYRAIEYFKETLMLDPQNAEAHASLARALAEQGGKKEAAKHLQEAIRILKTQRKSMTDASPPPRS
jgi:tetratricopeptide (TPR) repeat protein